MAKRLELIRNEYICPSDSSKKDQFSPLSPIPMSHNTDYELNKWHSTPADKMKTKTSITSRTSIALVEPTFYEESANASFSKKCDSRRTILPPASPARVPAISRFRTQPWMKHGAHSVNFKQNCNKKNQLRNQNTGDGNNSLMVRKEKLKFDDSSDDEDFSGDMSEGEVNSINFELGDNNRVRRPNTLGIRNTLVYQSNGNFPASKLVNSGIPNFNVTSPANLSSPEDEEIVGILQASNQRNSVELRSSDTADSTVKNRNSQANTPVTLQNTVLTKQAADYNTSGMSISGINAPGINIISPTRSASSINRSNQPSPNLIGQHIYRPEQRTSYFTQMFQVIKRLGAGSFGEVFQVKPKHQTNSSRELNSSEYAVKKSIQPFISCKDRERKFLEVQQHQMLPPHPNCVMFIQAWEEDGYLYIQQELCDRTLEQDMKVNYANKSIPEPKCMDYLLDLLNGVGHLHENQFMHLDIKPPNIFIGKDGRLKIGDFGLVSREGEQSEYTQEGDPRYMAQELLDSKFTCKADIYSLGVVVLEISTGLDPPKYGSLWHRLRSGGTIPIEFSSQISSDLHRIIVLMLRDWEERPSAQELLQMQCLVNRGNIRDNGNYSENSKSFIEGGSYVESLKIGASLGASLGASFDSTKKSGSETCHLVKIVLGWIGFLFVWILKSALNSLVWSLRLLPSDLLLKSNIQLLTPTSRCVGSCQQKLKHRLSRSDSRNEITRERLIANDAFSDDDGSPVLARKYLQQKQRSIPVHNLKGAVTPPRVRQRNNPVIPSSAPVLRYRNINKSVLGSFNRQKSHQENSHQRIKTPDQTNGSIGPTPYPAGHAQLLLQNGFSSPTNIYQSIREKATNNDSPLAEFFQDADVSQKLSFDSTDEEDSISPKYPMKEIPMHGNIFNNITNQVKAIVHPNNHLEPNNHNNQLGSQQGNHQQSLSSNNLSSNRTRRTSRNSSRSPLPSPLSNPQNSLPNNSQLLGFNKENAKMKQQPSPSAKKLQLFGHVPTPSCPPNSLNVNSDKKHVKQMRQRRPITPQSPEPNTPDKIQRFQSRLRKFRPNGSPNESLGL